MKHLVTKKIMLVLFSIDNPPQFFPSFKNKENIDTMECDWIDDSQGRGYSAKRVLT